MLPPTAPFEFNYSGPIIDSKFVIIVGCFPATGDRTPPIDPCKADTGKGKGGQARTGWELAFEPSGVRNSVDQRGGV